MVLTITAVRTECFLVAAGKYIISQRATYVSLVAPVKGMEVG